MRPFSDVEMLLDITVECPSGQRGRYEFDPISGQFVLAYNLSRSLPGHYGWVNDTLGADGEALDVMVLPGSQLESLQPGTTLQVRPVGVLYREDQDHKLLAVEPCSALWAKVYDLVDIDPAIKLEVEDFIKGFAPVSGWGGALEAWGLISQCSFRKFSAGPKPTGEITLEERKFTKDHVFSSRVLWDVTQHSLITERTLRLERDYCIDGKPVWVNGYKVRRWDFPGQWFNLVQVLGHQGETIGYYQDVQYPVLIAENRITTVDLVLDLWVWPDLSSKLLDKDEWDLLILQNCLPEPFVSWAWPTVQKIKFLWTSNWFQTHLTPR